MKNRLFYTTNQNLLSFFALAYAYTILMPWGTTDYTDRGFYIVLFQALFTTLFTNIFIAAFGKRNTEAAK